jgi:hypothetical protein
LINTIDLKELEQSDVINEFIHNAHIRAGHAGIQITYDELMKEEKFKEFKLTSEATKFLIRMFINSCNVCLLASKNTKRFKYPTKTYVASSPWEKVAIDLFSTEISSKVYLIVTDIISRYTFIFRIPNKEAETVGKELIKLFMVEGFPAQLISDNGKEFKNKLIEYIETKFHIKHIFSRFYHPVGIVERKVQTAKQLFIKLQNSTEQQFDDDEVLELIQYLMNNRKISSIGTTPFNLFRGRKFSTSISTQGGEEEEESEDFQLRSMIKKWLEINVQLYPMIKEKLMKIQERIQDKEITDKDNQLHKIIPREYGLEKGLIVFALLKGNLKLKKTLSNTYSGPYVIMERTKNDQYKVKMLSKSREQDSDKLQVFPLEHLQFIPKEKKFTVVERATNNSMRYYRIRIEDGSMLWIREDDSYIDFEKLYKNQTETKIENSLVDSEQ